MLIEGNEGYNLKVGWIVAWFLQLYFSIFVRNMTKKKKYEKLRTYISYIDVYKQFHSKRVIYPN